MFLSFFSEFTSFPKNPYSAHSKFNINKHKFSMHWLWLLYHVTKLHVSDDVKRARAELLNLQFYTNWILLGSSCPYSLHKKWCSMGRERKSDLTMRLSLSLSQFFFCSFPTSFSAANCDVFWKSVRFSFRLCLKTSILF